MAEVLIYSTTWSGKDSGSEAQEGLAKTVNAILKSHPSAKFEWLQSSACHQGNDYYIRTVLTVIVTL